MIEIVPIESREQWLNARHQDVTASAVGALFGVHPYLSHFALHAEKILPQPIPGDDNAVLRRGRLLEGAVAAAAAERRPDWQIVKATDYYRDAEARIGATPDFFIRTPDRGVGVMQAKTVAPRNFREAWDEENAPFWIVLQTLTEMMLTGCDWGVIAALVVDPYALDVHLYEVPRNYGAEERIRAAVAAFWTDIADGKEPQPNFMLDADLISALCPIATPLKRIDLTGDNALPILLDERRTLEDTLKSAGERKKAIDAEIKHKMGDAELATADGGTTIKFKNEARKGYTVEPTNPRVLRITYPRTSTKGYADDGTF